MSTALYREFLDDFQRASKRGLDILDEGSKHRSGDVEQDVYTTSNKHEDSAFLVGDLDDKVKLAVHPGRNLVDLNKPTWLIAHVKHLATQTLDAYNLPWEWDDVSDSSKWEPSRYHLCDVDSADLSTTHSEILVALS